MAISSSKPRQGTPSFFKILLDPSASHLPLPPAFVRRHFKDKIPKYPTLKTATGVHSWKLKLEQIDGNYCFATGWDKVVKDANLAFGDFLVFWLIDDFIFQVSIYGPNGCEKVLSPNLINVDECKGNRGTTGALPKKKEFKIKDDEIEIEIEEEEDILEKGSTVDDSPEEQHLDFQKIISATNNHIMRLPRKFVVEAKLESKRTISLKDLKGTVWPMNIRCEKISRRESCSRYYLSGWRMFEKHNELLEGDICLFKFKKRERVLTLAQVIKNKTIPRNKESLDQKTPRNSTPASEVGKRKRGRPQINTEPSIFVDVKSEDEESTPEVEEVKRKRGRPPLTKYHKVVYF